MPCTHQEDFRKHNSLVIIDGFSSYYRVMKIKMKEFHIFLPVWGQNTNKNNKN